jgi:HEPN domain-containing protein
MPTPKAVLTVIRAWLAKADNDLKNAVHALSMSADCPTDTVCFHAQQCVEKHIKAVGFPGDGFSQDP